MCNDLNFVSLLKQTYKMDKGLNNRFNGILLKVLYMSVKGKQNELAEFLKDMYEEISQLKTDITGFDGFEEYTEGWEKSLKKGK